VLLSKCGLSSADFPFPWALGGGGADLWADRPPPAADLALAAGLLLGEEAVSEAPKADEAVKLFKVGRSVTGIARMLSIAQSAVRLDLTRGVW
jgi:hypothetical protein